MYGHGNMPLVRDAYNLCSTGKTSPGVPQACPCAWCHTQQLLCLLMLWAGMASLKCLQALHYPLGTCWPTSHRLDISALHIVSGSIQCATSVLRRGFHLNHCSVHVGIKLACTLKGSAVPMGCQHGPRAAG
jgi:hypothetical protein